MKLIKDTHGQIFLDNKVVFIPTNMILGEFSKKLPPEYINACKFFGITLIDRTKTLDDGIDFYIIDSMCRESIDKSFEEITFDRADAILDNATQTNRKISLLWSGGIDSTTALLALYIKAKKRDCLERIQVFLTTHSIEEFENFYTQIILKDLSHKIITPPIYTYMNPSEIIVTGELGDQLFGSDFLEKYIKQGIHTMPYEYILPQIVSKKLNSTKDADLLLKFLEKQIEQSPIKIKTLYDYIWWLNYSMKWQYVTFRILSCIIEKREIPYEVEENMVHFFQSYEFQQWALRENRFKIKKEWQSYKYIAKEFINRYFEDAAYLQNKTKEQSLGNISKHESFSFLYKGA